MSSVLIKFLFILNFMNMCFASVFHNEVCILDKINKCNYDFLLTTAQSYKNNDYYNYLNKKDINSNHKYPSIYSDAKYSSYLQKWDGISAFKEKHWYNYSLSRLQIRNNSLFLLNTCFKYPQKMNKKMLFFNQFGIQNNSPCKTIMLGGGNRYIYNIYDPNIIIGYNTFLYLPILYQKMNLPYSISIGTEYWYHSLMVSLNSFYKISKDTSNNSDFYIQSLQYPNLGYQILSKIKFLYWPECIGSIKWEKFYYKNNYNHDTKYRYTSNKQLSLGIEYQFLPILHFSINNCFSQNKRYDTVFNITFDYKFYFPFMQQVKNVEKKYDTQLFSNNILYNKLHNIVEPFNACSVNKKIHINFTTLKNMHMISGYPGEIKFFKSDSDLLQDNIDNQLFQDHGGIITYLDNKIYKICLPNYPLDSNQKIYLFHNTRKDKQHINCWNKRKILVLTKKFQLQSSQSSMQKINGNNTEYYIENPSDINIKHTNTNESESNSLRTDNCSNKLLLNSNTENSSILVSSNDMKDNKSVILQNDRFCPVPPPLLKIQDQYSSQSNETTVKKQSQKEKNDYSLSYLLSMHRKSKFASIELPEYIEKLESNIEQQKKEKSISDIGKTLNKLCLTVSLSSIDDSYTTDDDNDNKF